MLHLIQKYILKFCCNQRYLNNKKNNFSNLSKVNATANQVSEYKPYGASGCLFLDIVVTAAVYIYIYIQS
jgi:hypothetical protein